MNYQDFIQNKIPSAPALGINIAKDDLNAALYPHQRDITHWSLNGGRRAVFAAFGLGKTYIQLEWCRQIKYNQGGKQLIIAPLGVRQEFIRDAKTLGIKLQFIRTTAEANRAGCYITNYESVREGKIDLNHFNATSLDEASILRSDNSKTHHTFIQNAANVPYRLVATATPSPNDYIEIIFYAAFLGIMDKGQAKTRFFKRDSSKADNLTLLPHKEQEFWLWVSTWATFIQKPSDLGYSDDGYNLPGLKIHYHRVAAPAPNTNNGQQNLFAPAPKGLMEVSKNKRTTLDARIQKLQQILNDDPKSHYILWHDTEAERHAIKKAVPTTLQIYGAQDLDTREQNIAAFSQGEAQYLATKPQLSGSGCNLQHHCHKAIFAGIGFKFNDFIQAIHRIKRFQQQYPCEIHLIYAENETHILDALQSKWQKHNRTINNMSDIIKKYGLNHQQMHQQLQRAIGVDRIVATGDNWTAVHNDCVEEVATHIADNSVDLIITSWPFSTQYEYTPNYNDFGHNKDNEAFFEQMQHLTPQLLRALKPGRIYAIHVKDRIEFGNFTGRGYPTVYPFHADVIQHMRAHHFGYVGMITINTDVVRENNQTYRLSYGQFQIDSSKISVGLNEYVLLFRKDQSNTEKGYADQPIPHSQNDYSLARHQIDSSGTWRSSGNRLPTPQEIIDANKKTAQKLWTEYNLAEIYDYDTHLHIGEQLEAQGKLPKTYAALAVAASDPSTWDNINRIKTLNTAQSQRRQQQHLCPLQFDIVDRLITRYSAPDELILDPFGGLMTVPLRAVKHGRKGYGIDLSPDYWADGVGYLQAADKKTPDLFGLINLEEHAEQAEQAA